MQMLNALNERLSHSITSGRSRDDLKSALGSLEISDEMIDRIVQCPIRVPLCLLIPALEQLKLEEEIFEICCFPFTRWLREKKLLH